MGTAAGRSAPTVKWPIKPVMVRNRKPMPAMVTRLTIVVQKIPRLTPAMPLSDKKYFFLNEANI